MTFFSGLLESRYAAQHKTNAEELSKSELVECATNQINSCKVGGTFDDAYTYTVKDGLLSEQEYPYRNGDGNVESCKRVDFGFNETLVKPVNFTIGERSYLMSGNPEEIKNLLYQYGPMFAHVNAALLGESKNFDIIRKDDVKCYPSNDSPDENNRINHGVVLVGYGVENDVPYWIIRNSWGTEYGKDGYHRMERGSNTCGIERCAILMFTN
uniref:Viral cathepsin n=1 Tax=Cacopsylla melanoneura TaxID=428564 RepID=A0A8D8QZ33_9HEMI